MFPCAKAVLGQALHCIKLVYSTLVGLGGIDCQQRIITASLASSRYQSHGIGKALYVHLYVLKRNHDMQYLKSYAIFTWIHQPPMEVLFFSSKNNIWKAVRFHISFLYNWYFFHSTIISSRILKEFFLFLFLEQKENKKINKNKL